MRVALCSKARECKQQGDGDLYGGAAPYSTEESRGDCSPARDPGKDAGTDRGSGTDRDSGADRDSGTDTVTCLVVLIGLPGSGKTSLCRTLTQHLGSCTLTVCYDDMMPASMGDLIPAVTNSVISSATDDWKEVRRAALDAVEAAAVQGHRFVLVDDNMYYRSMRRQCYQLARRLGLGFCQLYLHCELHDALCRNSNRSNAVPSEVVTRMAARLEPPDGKKHLWECASLVVDPENIDLSQIISFINNAAARPVPALQDSPDRSAPTPGPVHRADVVLRKLVGQRIREAGPALAATVTAARRRVLEDIRAGRIALPQDDACLQDFLASFLL